MVKAEPMEEGMGTFTNIPDEDDTNKETFWLILSRENSDLEVQGVPR